MLFRDVKRINKNNGTNISKHSRNLIETNMICYAFTFTSVLVSITKRETRNTVPHSPAIICHTLQFLQLDDASSKSKLCFLHLKMIN